MNKTTARQGLFSVLFLFSIALSAIAPLTAFAALPAGFEVETLSGGLTLPTAITFAPDGRIFIAEKGGAVRIWKNGAVLATPLIQLTDVNTYGDRGLIGIAIDPNFSTNGHLFLLYTYENTPGTNFAGPKTGRLVRVKVIGDVADESSKTVILGTIGGTLATPSCESYAVTADCIPSDSPSHSVGGLRFGPDGKLYVTLGDGSHFEYVDPRAMRAQNLDALAGKVLRINADGTAPSDNPYYTGSATANRSKVYAYGFRNAYRFNFRPSNNALYVGDVGWSNWEEVNKVVPGANYGWPCREGNATTTGYNCDVNPHVNPLYTYAHDGNGAGAIAAGAFPTAYPSTYNNSFFIGDYAQNWIKRVEVNAADGFVSVQNFMMAADGSNGPVALDRGPDGNIYYLAIYTGELKRFLYTTGNRQPNAVLNAAPTNGLAPLTVNFSATGSSDPDGNPLTYLWNFGDGTTSTSSAPVHTYAANGSYTAVLTVFDGQGGQNTKSKTITVGNQAPTAVISSPENGSLYKIGDTIFVSGHGIDAADGTITSVSKLVWTVIIHHNTHTHTYQTLNGPNPSFPAPDHESATDVYTEVRLTVTDSGGLTDTKSINLYLNNNPETSGNLIQNPSLEDAVVSAADTPEFWIRGGYGINNVTYTYPVVGFDGADAAKVSMSSYTDGDAKWFHNPVTIAPNTSYNFSGYFMGNTSAGGVVQIGYGNGTYTYIDLGDAAPGPSWTRVDRRFTTPAGAQTAVVGLVLNGVGELTIDNFSLTQSTSTPPVGDTTKPVVSVISPLAGETVSGTTTITANASDNVAVVDVKFLIDATVVNTDTTSPYTFAWNSKSVANGNHSLLAVARDAAGNIATSTPVTFAVLNQTSTSTPGGSNLVLNPSAETAGSPTTVPQDWFNGKWGTNTTTFTYPVAGFDGAKAMQVKTTAYTNGDAKWFFKDVPVTPGTQYTYSSYYMASSTSNLTLRYTLANGSVSYVALAATVPASATWKKLTYNFTPPVNTVSVTAFHMSNKVGTLTTDLYSITGPGGAPADTTAPTVSISSPTAAQEIGGTAVSIKANAADAGGVAGVKFFVDSTQIGAEDTVSPYEVNFNTTTVTNHSNHILRAVARDTAGNIATSTPVTVFVHNHTEEEEATSTPGNLINNASFETANGANPLGWNHGGWGVNTANYVYPVTGRDGNKAAEVRVTAYSDGDVKWFPDRVPMQFGKEYTFSSWYKSDVISDVIGAYTLTDGTQHYFGVIKELPPVTGWTFFNATFTPPVNAVNFTPFHLISSIGTLTTDDVSLVITGSATSTNDIIAPVVQITSPANNAVVSNTVTVVASSSDNVGVTGVMFAVDGNPVTANLPAPYNYVWDTKTVANGLHTLKATTHDAAGNNSTHTISVTVNNSTSTNPNMVDNPSLEMTDASGNPTGWSKNSWGTITPVFTYPVAGSDGTKAAKVVVSAYTSGDAKWFFASELVTASTTYVYSNYYKSTVATTLTARYTMSTGAFMYVDLATVPAAANWTKYEREVTMPSGAVGFTVFHLIKSVGELNVDQYSLSVK